MRILVIRDERCGRLSERVESFLKEKNVDYDVFMASGETKACLVCGQCIKKSTCIIEDDLKKTGGNLSSYDGVMIVTSIFYDRISLPMKNVLVRFARAYLPSLFAKPAIALGISRNGRNGDLQEVVDFFACSGIVLIFGLGLDYLVYGLEQKTGKATLLSFVTTELSFGALALSSFVPAHVFGLTVCVGVALAYLLSCLINRS